METRIDAFGPLGPIDVPKSSDLLAQRLRAEILGGRYADGAALPTERELVSQTGLSRGSVREGLRILEAQGLVETRPGRHGGTVVRRPTDNLLADQVSLFAKGRALSIEALIEAREALEPMLAQLAAQKRTDEDLTLLRSLFEQIAAAAGTDIERFLRLNVAWHCALAQASHNDLLRAFMVSIAGLVHEASRIEDFANDDVRRLVVQALKRILLAIEQRDAEAARRRMERHVRAYSLQARLFAAAAQTNTRVEH